MQIKILSLDECRAALRTAGLGRVACVRYNQPYIVPISFDFKDDALYSFATAGKKIHWMRANPRVCVEVEDIRDRFNWTTVIVEGRYEELTDSKENEEARAYAQSLVRAHRHWRYPASVTPDPTRARNPVLFRIHIESVSGRHAFQTSALERWTRTPASRLRRWWQRAARSFKGQAGSGGDTHPVAIQRSSAVL